MARAPRGVSLPSAPGNSGSGRPAASLPATGLSHGDGFGDLDGCLRFLLLDLADLGENLLADLADLADLNAFPCFLFSQSWGSMAQVLGQNPRRFPHTCADMRRHLNLHKNFLLRARTDDANHIHLGRPTTFQ